MSYPADKDDLSLETDLFGTLVVPQGAGRAETLRELAGRAALYATRARSEGTRRAYRSAWRAYAAWCRSLGRDPLAGDAETIAMYAVRRADDGLSVASLRVHLAAIQAAHRLAGLSLDPRDPRLGMVMEGITRSKGLRPRRRAAAAGPESLRLMLAACPLDTTPRGARDRAMLLLGFAAALRRSEVTNLALGDVEMVPGRGLRLLLRRSKTDPRGSGEEVAVCANPRDSGFCPVAALARWLAVRRQAPDLTRGRSDAERPLFCAITRRGQVTGAGLSDKAVWRLVKRAAAEGGLPDPGRYSGHSLRAGLATAAAEAGAGLADVMRQTRHKSSEVALGYLRPEDLWRNNVTGRVFGCKPDDAS
ncbi:MAG: tyrosine-type recombinase/integrase [Paracraurococcus sp.]